MSDDELNRWAHETQILAPGPFADLATERGEAARAALEARAEAERLRTLFEDTERVRKSNLRACLEAQAEVERLRAVLRNLSVVVSADYEWVSDAMQAAADGRWDIVPPEAKGERRG